LSRRCFAPVRQRLPHNPPVHGVTPGHKCEAGGLSTFIGRASGGETGAAIKRASHAAVLRWAPPGVMLTMDYREDRVTVYLGPDKKVTEIKCG
jgi:hypothetical protein